jgi:hypothetical protein
MWTPTRRKIGEGGTEGEEPGAGARQSDNRRALIGSTGVVSTACQKGNRASVGEARDGRGNGDPRTSPERAADHLGVGKGQRYRRSRVTPVEGRALASGVLEKEERTGDCEERVGQTLPSVDPAVLAICSQLPGAGLQRRGTTPRERRPRPRIGL